ncbi:PspC domain-containing protein [Actinomadura sp. BRA 177]|uniref:PspC domain-containing protein n=1 Tax=Actinomadura sp. BRA 177 TaxID=2745202 RepID=UPI001595610B|nr:PspC domain-containing protein [Actinomadura sp. BRA 177]NVI90880.1 PspC domain-containing protein [Actinomadura sp. BRA 177]
MDMEKNTTKQLRRTRDNRMISGVSAGAARYLDIDVNLVRLGFAVLAVFGPGIPIYILAWLLIPEEGAATSVAEDLFKKASDSPTVQDAVQKTKDTVNKNRTSA